jgi:MATE family multidrug resistance protein
MEDNWPAFECATVFSGWGEFLRLGLPGAVSLLIEWGSFELAAGIAAQLGPVPLAVHGVYMSTANIFYMMPQVHTSSP